MRCIFCKNNSIDSVSIEHIIPESLGNKKTTLPKGVVCDSCNNYFASKVEKYVLESDEFRYLRSNQIIKNKKGKAQEVTLFIDKEPIRARRTSLLEFAIHTEDFNCFEKTIKKRTSEIRIPASGDPPSNHYMSRFLAKMGLELLAYKWLDDEGWNDYIVEHEGLDVVRKFARSPLRNEVWEFSKRRIYEENLTQTATDGGKGQVIYECDILAIGSAETHELYFVFAIFGMEYAINLGGNSMFGYYKWLNENNNSSPLFKKPYTT